MNKKIIVINDQLQTVIDYFVTYIKEEMKLDLNKDILTDEQFDQWDEIADEAFIDYEVYNSNLFNLAGALYHEGYNVLDKAIEQESNSPLIINEVLKEYVINVVEEYQQKLINEKKAVNLAKIKIK